MKKIIEVVMFVVITTMLVLAAVGLAHYAFDIGTAWYPFSFATYLRVAGCVYVLAIVAEICLQQNTMGRWTFVFLLSTPAYWALVPENLPIEFPVTPRGQFGLAIHTILLSFGAMHLQYRLKEARQG
ncbi:MAG: hypothetical protein AAB552_03835 [Patescibacteria group bacterium]